MGIATFTPLPRCSGVSCKQGRSACTCATGRGAERTATPRPLGNTVPMPKQWDNAECRRQVEQWLDEQPDDAFITPDARPDVTPAWRTFTEARMNVAVWALTVLNVGIWAGVVLALARLAK